MECTLLALAWPDAASRPLDSSTAALSFLIALAFTAAVGWFADRLSRARNERLRSALARATPVAGVH